MSSKDGRLPASPSDGDPATKSAFSDETGREQAFERFPKLAGWIERLAGTQMDLSLKEWGEFLAELNVALSASPVAQEPVATKKVYIKPLRTIVEIQTAYADQIRDWLNASPPATPAGLGADEIARALKETLVAGLDAHGTPIISGFNSATTAILALLSRS